MTDYRADSDRLQPLLAAMLDGQLDDEQIAELRRLLDSDPAARKQYVRQIATHGMLQWAIGGKTNDECGAMNDGWPVSPTLSEIHPSSSTTHLCDSSSRFGAYSPLTASLSPAFVGSPVFSYMVATLILGVMFLGAWAYKISHNNLSLDDNRERSTTSGLSADNTPEMVFVGRVTGMINCRWADSATMTYLGSSVPLGRRYALSAGLMEVTYGTGAKVILEGPCTYKVESRTSGYLAQGNLTARMEKRPEVRGRNPRPKPQDLRPQSEISEISSPSAPPRRSSPTWAPSSASRSAMKETLRRSSFAG